MVGIDAKHQMEACYGITLRLELVPVGKKSGDGKYPLHLVTNLDVASLLIRAIGITAPVRLRMVKMRRLASESSTT